MKDNYTFEHFEKVVNSITEDQAKHLLSIIYPERRGIRANISPIAKSYRKRLLYNVKHYWNNIDLEKLENKFKQLSLSIYPAC